MSHIIEPDIARSRAKNLWIRVGQDFWRFPIKVAAREAAPVVGEGSKGTEGPTPTSPNKKIEGADDYINEGLVHYKDLPKSEATEIPWEKFEEASTIGSLKQDREAVIQSRTQ